ncbi:MAG: hypothetical protein J2P50_20095 [Hyphomicrobiaceae bacterium]|nr:hypothetical protein [Hyphomicrobiaceae bacterium]
MRGFAYGLGALALVGLIHASGPAEAAKTKMGCERGKQVWDATAGSCVRGKPKARTKTASRKAKKAAGAKKE